MLPWGLTGKKILVLLVAGHFPDESVLFHWRHHISTAESSWIILGQCWLKSENVLFTLTNSHCTRTKILPGWTEGLLFLFNEPKANLITETLIHRSLMRTMRNDCDKVVNTEDDKGTFVSFWMIVLVLEDIARRDFASCFTVLSMNFRHFGPL